ncbi:MAG: hypothetical protein P8Y52_14435, partial [Xanthomonadales bacterium]
RSGYRRQLGCRQTGSTCAPAADGVGCATARPHIASNELKTPAPDPVNTGFSRGVDGVFDPAARRFAADSAFFGAILS